jgi:dihydroorotase
MFDLILKGGMAVTPNGIEEADIGVTNGRITAIGALDAGKAGQVIDAKGLHVLPGCIDTQVHFREPGMEHKEDLSTGTAGAALGGITGVFDMPNTKPSTTTPEALNDKLKRAQGRAWVEHAFYLGACAENVEQLAKWERLPGCAGVKLFMGSSTGTLLVDDKQTLLHIAHTSKRRMAVHAEDEERLKERRHLVEGGNATAAMHPVWRDEETAKLATWRLLDIAHAAKRLVHVLHITTAEELEILARYRDIASVEVTPQHLTLAAPECYERLGNYAQMNPPIRDARHREALWAAVRAGLVDCLGSDHAPHTREEKDKPYPASPSGMPGVQTLVPVMLDHVNAGRLSLLRFVDLVCSGPARLFGLIGKGSIRLGYDADFTLVDLKAKRTITNQWMASRCGWTPFDGMSVTGWPMATIVRGNVVMYEGQLQGQPLGQPFRFYGC